MLEQVEQVEQVVDHHERAIRDYLLEYPEKNENQVVKEMMIRGICSRITTLKTIDKMLERGILEDIKVKKNSLSRLVVRNTNEFTNLSQRLQNIEKTMTKMDKRMRRFNQFLATKNPAAASYKASFVIPYVNTINTMLCVLQARVKESISSKEDSITLSNRIIDLMMKLSKQAYDVQNCRDLLQECRKNLTKGRKDFSDPGTTNAIIDVEGIDSILSLIDDFEKQILV